MGIRPSRHLLNKDFPGKTAAWLQHFDCNVLCDVFNATILNSFLGTDDKIDSNFSDLTSRFDGIVDHEENCILEALCERHQGTFSKFDFSKIFNHDFRRIYRCKIHKYLSFSSFHSPIVQIPPPGVEGS